MMTLEISAKNGHDHCHRYGKALALFDMMLDQYKNINF